MERRWVWSFGIEVVKRENQWAVSRVRRAPLPGMPLGLVSGC